MNKLSQEQVQATLSLLRQAQTNLSEFEELIRNRYDQCEETATLTESISDALLDIDTILIDIDDVINALDELRFVDLTPYSPPSRSNES